DSLVRRECFEMVLARPDAFPTQLEAALRSRDQVVRGWAVDGLRSAPLGAEMGRLLIAAARDASALGRRSGWVSVFDRLAAGARGLAERAVLDLNARVRLEAVAWLRRQPAGFDPRAYYRAAVHGQAGRRLHAALAALAEVGRKDDLSVIEPLIRAESPRTRRF